jgi:thymidylate synthase (FAD)
MIDKNKKYKDYRDYASVELIAMTEPLKINPLTNCRLTPEEFLAYTARVSNPSNQMNTLTSGKLLNYCIKNKHWSVFEIVSLCFEINTTRDIGRQIIRHKSFSIQEFSGRYSDPTKELGFVSREARLQDNKNRQNSIEIVDDNDPINEEWYKIQVEVIEFAESKYNRAIELGIAKENARSVLPEGNLMTRMYFSGTLRSFIHYTDIRSEMASQKEHRIISDLMKKEIKKHFSFIQ